VRPAQKLEIGILRLLNEKRQVELHRNSKFLIDDDLVYEKATKIAAMLREIINGTLCITK
jgi:hypothetical protein